MKLIINLIKQRLQLMVTITAKTLTSQSAPNYIFQSNNRWLNELIPCLSLACGLLLVCSYYIHPILQIQVGSSSAQVTYELPVNKDSLTSTLRLTSQLLIWFNVRTPCFKVVYVLIIDDMTSHICSNLKSSCLQRPVWWNRIFESWFRSLHLETLTGLQRSKII